MTWRETYEKWLNSPALSEEEWKELDAIRDDPKEIEDRFYAPLVFGTAGLRGIMGLGTNRMNIHVIRHATQAFAELIVAEGTEAMKRGVCVCHDCRNNGVTFAREAAAIMAANGVHVRIFESLRPTPELSFAIRHYGAEAGINVTASHNPAEYNGYKVYGSDGCQMTPEAAKRVVALLEQMDYFTAARTEDFDAALAAGRIQYIPDEVLDAFVDAVYAQRVGSGDGIADLKLVYTPLNGAGLECVRKLTQKLGIRNMTIVKEQEQPDGHFPTCPYPNPEIRQAMELGLQYCDRVHPDILIGTDPDCDRCGTAVPDGKGGYRLISGNEMGVILLDFICRSRIANGTMPENPVAVTTIVSTDMVTAVANKYGVELRRVLTGFKYIGEQIALLEAGGHPERYIFGFEESYGYLSGPHVRDKDAVNAVLLICEAAAWYAKKGMTLGDAIDALYAEFGCFCNAQKSFTFAGETGMEKMASLMSGLRTHPLQSVAGLQVEGFTDYEQDGTGLPKANVLEYRLPGGAKLIIRPSGTEPKIKAYLSAVKPTVEEATRQLDTLAAAAAELLA